MGVLTLAATQGSKIHVEATGEEAERAVKAIEKLIETASTRTSKVECYPCIRYKPEINFLRICMPAGGCAHGW